MDEHVVEVYPGLPAIDTGPSGSQLPPSSELSELLLSDSSVLASGSLSLIWPVELGDVLHTPSLIFWSEGIFISAASAAGMRAVSGLGLKERIHLGRVVGGRSIIGMAVGGRSGTVIAVGERPTTGTAVVGRGTLGPGTRGRIPTKSSYPFSTWPRLVEYRIFAL